MFRARLLLSVFSAAFFIALATGCAKKGPAEKAGEQVDKAIENVRYNGPAERVGKKIDEAVNKAIEQ